MGGKGRRRREKNYLAAHGLKHSHLPPPPNISQVDALPSKLRLIMSFASPVSDPFNNPTQLKKKKKDIDSEKSKKDANIREATIDDGEDGDVDPMTSQFTVDDDVDGDKGVMDDGREEKKKKKRKTKQVNDLRFTEVTKTSDKKRERRKKYLEAKKKKKHKSSKAEDSLSFPGREHVKFGDIVQAPPKLVTVPKVLKHVPDASQERIRLRTIEEYRKRKGWTSRPGLRLPNMTVSPSL